MSNTKNSPFDFGNMMPGFDFLKQMASKSPASNPFMPNAGSWITPTLSVEELDKRINELKTVKMWLENNARLIDATVQAMQVQKMTLATLKTMNVKMADISKSFTGGGSTSVKSSTSSGSSAKTTRNKTEFDLGQKPKAAAKSAAAPKPAAAKSAAAEQEPEANALAVQNAMQFWNGLTQQFGQITEQVLQDSKAAAAQMAKTSKTASARSTTARSKTTAAKKAPASKTTARKTSKR